MANESWVRTHQQRIQAEAIEDARRAELARQVAVESGGLRAILADHLVLLATWLDDRPHTASTRSGPAQASSPRHVLAEKAASRSL